MRAKLAMAILVATVVSGGLTGCAMFNQGTLHYVRTTTMGQELTDLQEAKAKGAVSDEEYAKAKKAILAGGPLQLEDGAKGK